MLIPINGKLSKTNGGKYQLVKNHVSQWLDILIKNKIEMFLCFLGSALPLYVANSGVRFPVSGVRCFIKNCKT